jgi:hypothetical protein
MTQLTLDPAWLQDPGPCIAWQRTLSGGWAALTPAKVRFLHFSRQQLEDWFHEFNRSNRTGESAAPETTLTPQTLRYVRWSAT